LSNVKRVVVDKGIRLRESGLSEGHKEAEAAPHAHGGVNPHYWLSISNGEVIARSVAEEIIQLDPANESHYRANLHAYQSKLVAAKKEIDRRIRDLPNRKIITFHNAWPYYAEEFGLEVVATFEPFPGKQPTPRYLVELHQKTQEHNVTSLFSEPQLWTEAIEPFVSDMGLELYVLDPLGGVEGRNSYIELLEYNTDVIVKALSNE
jgi:zinc transport system substrate-binding protein